MPVAQCLKLEKVHELLLKQNGMFFSLIRVAENKCVKMHIMHVFLIAPIVKVYEPKHPILPQITSCMALHMQNICENKHKKCLKLPTYAMLKCDRGLREDDEKHSEN